MIKKILHILKTVDEYLTYFENNIIMNMFFTLFGGGSLICLTIGIKAQETSIIIQYSLFLVISILVIMNNIKISKAEAMMKESEKHVGNEE